MTGKNILIADHDQAVLDLLVDILRGRGHALFLASNGKKAAEIVRLNPIDLALLDWKTSFMDEMDALSGIKIIDENIQVVILTAPADADSLRHILDKGARDYLLKLFHKAELLASVKDALERREFVSKRNRKLEELQDPLIELNRKVRVTRMRHDGEPQIEGLPIVGRESAAPMRGEIYRVLLQEGAVFSTSPVIEVSSKYVRTKNSVYQLEILEGETQRDSG